jgi:hypothetical protein
MTKFICVTYEPTKIYFEVPEEWDLDDIRVLDETLYYKDVDIEVKEFKVAEDTHKPASIEPIDETDDLLKSMLEFRFQAEQYKYWKERMERVRKMEEEEE